MDIVKGPDNELDQTLKRLIDSYQSMLMRLCYLYLHDVQLAEDAVQETFIKAARSLPNFRGECSEKTWLTRIAIHTCCDIRRGSWYKYIDRKVTPDMLPEAAQTVPDEERCLTLAVMNLPLKLREAVVLYYYQDITTVEIAQMLGVTQATVSYRLKQGRQKLKHLLERSELT